MDIVLGTTLTGLAKVMLALCLDLCLSITSDASNGLTDATGNAVFDTGSQVGDLALCLLALAGEVLLTAVTLQLLVKLLVNCIKIDQRC